jgi:hypothetical protein
MFSAARSSSHSAVVFVAETSSMIAYSSSVCSVREAWSAKRGSSNEIGRPPSSKKRVH